MTNHPRVPTRSMVHQYNSSIFIQKDKYNSSILPTNHILVYVFHYEYVCFNFGNAKVIIVIVELILSCN